jgi:hypothetical protein
MENSMAGSDDLNQAMSWQGVVRDLESRVESLTLALEDVRFLVRQLAIEALASAPAEFNNSHAPSVYGHEAAKIDWSPPTTVAAPEPAPAAWESLDYKLPPVDAGWGSLHSFAEPEPPEPPSIAPQAAEQPVASDPSKWADPIVDWPQATPSPSGADVDPARDEVRRAVEQMRAEMENSPSAWAPEEPQQAWAPDEAHGEPHAWAPETPQTPSHEPSTWNGPVTETQVDPWGAFIPQAPGEPEAAPDSEALRDEVRRAVEMARQELEAGTLYAESQDGHAATAYPASSDEPSASYEPASSPTYAPAEASPASAEAAAAAPPVFEYRQEERVSTPSIVIEDPEGRVELVRVYDTLSRVNCADQAVLLNYTPHSVTVGIGLSELPSVDALKNAVRAVFSRPCEVTKDGFRISVIINNGQERAA